MSKPILKLLLVALSTSRPVEGIERRVRFAPGKVVELTEDELEQLDKLTVATGKLHYRDPVNEGGATVTASEPELVAVKDYAGQDTPLADKTADQLKAYLTFYDVAFKGNASKADLLELATAHAAGDTPADPDAGL